MRTPARQSLISGTAIMLAGTLVATIGAYLFQLLGGRVLGPEAYAPITVLWSVQFLVMTVVMLPVEQFIIIRRLELSRGASVELRDSAAPLLALLLGTVLCVCTSLLVLGDRLQDDAAAYVVLSGLLVATYSVFAAARGFLAGSHRYRDYGLATAAEALGRLLMAGAVLLVDPQALALAVVLVLAPLCVLVVRPFTRTQNPAEPEHHTLSDEPSVDVLVGRAGRFLGPLVVANGASQTLLGAGPLVLAGLGASAATVSAVFVTFTLFRGPLWVMQSALSRALPPFTALVRRGDRTALRRWATRLAVLGVGLGCLAGPVGWWLGPDVVALLFGEAFRPSAMLTALAAAGTVLAGATALSSQILVSLDATWRVAVAWILAIAAAGLALVPSGPADIRVGLAFLVGEVTALALVTALTASHASSLRDPRPRR